MGKDIYQLELHETMIVDMVYNVTRVPGGWIYSRLDSGSAFVPWDNEFKKHEDFDIKDIT